MDNYKINYIFGEDKDINDVFVKVLNNELKKYILMISKKNEVFPLCIYSSLEGGKNC